MAAGDAYTRRSDPSPVDGCRGQGCTVYELHFGPLLAAYVSGDDGASMRATRAALSGLAEMLRGTRYGERIAQVAAGDPAWSAQLRRAAWRPGGDATGAYIAAIAKRDRTVIESSARPGWTSPPVAAQRHPVDGSAAVAHLETLASRRA